MASERLIAFFALGILMTFLAQTKSVEATRRVVIPVGPRIVQCMKKVDLPSTTIFLAGEVQT